MRRNRGGVYFFMRAINGEGWLLGDQQKVVTSEEAEAQQRGFEKLNIL